MHRYQGPHLVQPPRLRGPALYGLGWKPFLWRAADLQLPEEIAVAGHLPQHWRARGALGHARGPLSLPLQPHLRERQALRHAPRTGRLSFSFLSPALTPRLEESVANGR